ncbi:MAG TPA: hypothetical protein VK488_12945 [Gaiellaceae bacterium]|nr:hypothetical protein [Gaiellaceae bacterium]
MSTPEAEPQPAPQANPTGGRAVDDEFTRTAKKDGRQVVTLRRLMLGNQFIVESDVYPVGTMRIDPVRPGPYVFGSRDEASAFMDETTLALEYLGCEIS